MISVDTVFADIAEKAIESGADVVNDVAGFATDGGMLDVVAEHGCPAVVMAAGKLPGDPLGMDAIMQSLDDILIRSEERGIDTDQLILDPAIGKWVPEKSAMYDLETIDQFERLKVFES
jgi:dihydropteroate synthase